jgi:hypothetical protein
VRSITFRRFWAIVHLSEAAKEQEPKVTYHIGHTRAVDEQSHHPLLGGSASEPHRYHRQRGGRRITRTYGAVTVRYSYKKAS